MGWLWAVTVGVVAGLIATALLPGRRAAPLWPALVQGVAGSLLGGLVAGWAGMDDARSADCTPHLLQLAGAVLVVAAGTPLRPPAPRGRREGRNRPLTGAPGRGHRGQRDPVTPPG